MFCPLRTRGSFSGFPSVSQVSGPQGEAEEWQGTVQGCWGAGVPEPGGKGLALSSRMIPEATQHRTPMPWAWFSCAPQILRREGAVGGISSSCPFRNPASRGKCHNLLLQPFQDSRRAQCPGAGDGPGPRSCPRTGKGLWHQPGSSAGSLGVPGAGRGLKVRLDLEAAAPVLQIYTQESTCTRGR